MKIALYFAILVSWVSSVMLAGMANDYVTIGYGLMPEAAALGVLINTGLALAAEHVIEMLDDDEVDVNVN